MKKYIDYEVISFTKINKPSRFMSQCSHPPARVVLHYLGNILYIILINIGNVENEFYYQTSDD